ncbi:glycine-rich cell wall structural protein 1.0 [Selaginella moellendorffii]|uniref:glycine-rich cell wall structural protein 1.0 n=1 Tax=Selaginella moellendorffii TaxID=88036 RepID=UPI000D1CE59E|nr:glycine-rich cell wall structural protein 1.0 [Selaginella moellendorffii]|eukprot:XP_024517177.1 glycine-rich cell wall structural protein 1.0 [Selaginella moellendorffii]
MGGRGMRAQGRAGRGSSQAIAREVVAGWPAAATFSDAGRGWADYQSSVLHTLAPPELPLVFAYSDGHGDWGGGGMLHGGHGALGPGNSAQGGDGRVPETMHHGESLDWGGRGVPGRGESSGLAGGVELPGGDLGGGGMLHHGGSLDWGVRGVAGLAGGVELRHDHSPRGDGGMLRGGSGGPGVPSSAKAIETEEDFERKQRGLIIWQALVESFMGHGQGSDGRESRIPGLVLGSNSSSSSPSRQIVQAIAGEPLSAASGKGTQCEAGSSGGGDGGRGGDDGGRGGGGRGPGGRGPGGDDGGRGGGGRGPGGRGPGGGARHEEARKRKARQMMRELASSCFQ